MSRIIAAAVRRILFCAAVLTAAPAFASDEIHPPPYVAQEPQKRSFSTGAAFFDDARVVGSLYYFQRKRMRFNQTDERWHNNLDHATTGMGAEFSSGFIGDVIGVDVGAFSAFDLWNSSRPFHELSFFPARDPWNVDWGARHPDDGVSLHKALVKAQAGNAWAKAGYFQPSGPGVLGVNWSVYPGTYRGVETGFSRKGFSVAAAWADQYKAPWYKDAYGFRRDDGSSVAWLWTLGARYVFDEASGLRGTTVELAYGESQNYLKNGHAKIKNERPAGDGALTLGYQLYVMNDSDSGGPNDNFDGPATQHFFFSKYSQGQWTFQAEATHTYAPQNNESGKGYFAYRLISAYGGAQGALEPDWNTRSDWNHHRETAVFLNASRKFSIFGHQGFEAGFTYSHGWDGKARGYSGRLNEWAFAFDLGYVAPSGPLQGGSVKAHYTEYRNSSNKPDWIGFKNAFQDERDFKLLIVVPFSF